MDRSHFSTFDFCSEIISISEQINRIYYYSCTYFIALFVTFHVLLFGPCALKKLASPLWAPLLAWHTDMSPMAIGTTLVKTGPHM